VRRGVRLIPLFVFALILTLFDGQAIAQPTCTYDDGEVIIALGSGEDGTLSLDLGGVLVFEGKPCEGGATQFNSKVVDVTGSTGAETFTVDEGGEGGRFTLPFSIDLGEGVGDGVVVFGTPDDDVVAIDSAGVNFGDARLDFVGVENLEVDAQVGDDFVVPGQSGNVIVAVPNPSPSASFEITARGGEGNDTLVGGLAHDSLFGNSGADTLDGGPGADLLIGGQDADVCLLDGARVNCEPAITVSPGSGEVGDVVTVGGTGWYPENGEVVVSIGSADGTTTELLRAPLVSPDDTFSGKEATIPPVESGLGEITACQWCPPSRGNESATPIPFTVDAGALPPPPVDASLVLQPPSAGPGDRVKIVGRDWPQDEGPVSLFVQSQDGQSTQAITPIEPSPKDRILTRFFVPDFGDGPYTVLGCQHCDAPDEIEFRTLLAVEKNATSPVPWIAAAVGALLVLGIGTIALRRRIVPRRATGSPPAEVPHYVLTNALPRVEVSKAPDQSTDHSIRLVPSRDVGVQRVEEMIGS
jgi:hypothetical protein